MDDNAVGVAVAVACAHNGEILSLVLHWSAHSVFGAVTLASIVSNFLRRGVLAVIVARIALVPRQPPQS